MARVQLFCSEPTRTKQSFKDECDVNIMMKRFRKNVGVDFLNKFQGYVDGNFGDFSNVTDYRSAIEQVRSANEMFMGLPAVLRTRFQNDAAQFLDFVQNPSNADALVEMGIATKGAPIQNAPSSTQQSQQESANSVGKP